MIKISQTNIKNAFKCFNDELDICISIIDVLSEYIIVKNRFGVRPNFLLK